MPGRISAWLIAILRRDAPTSVAITASTATRSSRDVASGKPLEHQRSGDETLNVARDGPSLDAPIFPLSISSKSAPGTEPRNNR
jgi:hypothetical protein